MDRQTPIMDAIAQVCGNSKARFCMPGHKGDSGFFGGDMLSCDITELPGTDNLHNAKGAILKSQTLHAEYIGAEAVYYTTGGSTACVLAMLSLFGGRKVIFPRGVHLSAANAINMYGLNPVFLDSPPCDYPATVQVDAIKKALRENKDAAAVFITYPNYFGLCCDIESIANIAHKAGLPLVVDAAHAAHFAYSGLLPAAPSYTGADIWTESAHKTLPAMNQCACLCVGRNSFIDKNKVLRALLNIQTTSPSYVLLASLDYAHAYMRDTGENELYRIISVTGRFENMVNALSGFTCPEIVQPGVIGKDPLKLVIDVGGTGYTGLAVKKRFAEQGIYVEAADFKNILLMLSVGNTASQLERLYESLRRVPKVRGKNIYFSPYSMPPATKYSQNFVNCGNIEKVRIERSPGRIAARGAGVYPPAEAVVIRGQLISVEIAGYLIEARRQGFDLFGTQDDNIFVFKEK
ncbi:MAG: aminotransferase class I/II-fold pyridoxal phosphate-dependent enzyme [Christensenellales bacterium]